MKILLEILSLQYVQIFLSVLIGALVTWLVARIYYVKASKELRKEAEKLRHLNELILRALEEADGVKITRNKAGEPIGLVIKLAGGSSIKIGLSGSLTVSKDSQEEKND